MAEAALRIGHVFGVTLTKWVGRWEARFPDLPLRLVEVDEGDQRRVLDDGTVDACFVRLPIEPGGLHVVRLYEEVRVAWASKDHGIALYDELTLDDLAGEQTWTEVTEATLMEAVFGDGVFVVPMSVARSHGRKDFVVVPITDAPTTHIALAWPVDADSETMQEFVGIVRGRTVNSSRSASTPKPRPARKPTRESKRPPRAGRPPRRR